MDNDTPASPVSSSGSNSDAFNTESARVYFGPLKTPERKFVAGSKTLFPPAQPTAVRRSPRLSSPRLRSASPMDIQEMEDDIKDIEQVEQLVRDSDEDEKDDESGMRTPQLGEDSLLDEPSSALADRVIHALDNPSPPPSPPSTLRIFDPYHTSTPEGPTDYHRDLMSLKINDNHDSDSGSLPFASTGEQQAGPSSLSTTPAVHGTADGCLIAFDFVSTPSKPQENPPEHLHKSLLSQSRPVLSVDDLLSQSPTIFVTPPQCQPSLNTPDPRSESTNYTPSLQGESLMLVDASSSRQVAPTIVLATSPPPSLEERTSTPPLLTEGLEATPLRRSTRPRRSVTPMLAATPNPPVFIAPPSVARTQLKKKIATPNRNDEVVSDSQGEESDTTPSNVATIIRSRHRSPGKAPLSFHRELGSLSPTSSNVLATLAFSAADDPTSDNTSTVPTNQVTSSSQQSMFSFSVFTPPNEVPSTPARSTGPVRFPSPAKVNGSPDKYRIRTPALGDPTNTPARRIPIAEGIIQGHVSPEKAVQLGLSTMGTPLPSVSTPARRVPISDGTAALMKSSNLRPASPMKKVSGQRDPSAEPIQRLGSSLKDKEKTWQAAEERTTAMTKLPFPLVPSAPGPSSQKEFPDDTVHVTRSSPAKSTLKQPTSRIPRIGAKPYARADPKVPKKATTTAADVAKPPPKAVDSAAVARKNARDAMKNTASGSASRIKPANMTSITTTLKRKREGELTSPAKPRVIMLRQVPPLETPPIETLSISQLPAPVSTVSTKGKRPAGAQALMRIRRVLDPEPTPPVNAAVAQKSPPNGYSEITTNISKQQVVEPSPPITHSTSSHRMENPELTPGSPMKQDPVDILSKAPDQFGDDPPSSSATNDATDAGTGLRRTTRSRRGTATQDVFGEGSSRTGSARRRAPVFHHDDVLSGMSMTALKDLTVSNTVKNQRYVAAKLETEVIRMEGTRPESPAVKIRTIVQRQQEERERERAERANRRARRSGEDIPSSDMMEFPNNTGHSDDSMSGSEDGESPVRHTRGAGEEDDYETPDRYKHMKPLRLFGITEEGKEAGQLRRRVKWDRGLFTTVYLDEVRLGTRQTLKENHALKGILAPTAKAIRLDTLGNHPHAESPLGDIVQENITVKKIVYDSDVAAAVAEVAAAVRSTRSKSKKK